MWHISNVFLQNKRTITNSTHNGTLSGIVSLLFTTWHYHGEWKIPTDGDGCKKNSQKMSWMRILLVHLSFFNNKFLKIESTVDSESAKYFEKTGLSWTIYFEQVTLNARRSTDEDEKKWYCVALLWTSVEVVENLELDVLYQLVKCWTCFGGIFTERWFKYIEMRKIISFWN